MYQAYRPSLGPLYRLFPLYWHHKCQNTIIDLKSMKIIDVDSDSDSD